MSALKVAGICALVSVLSLVGALIRGDLMCASTFTGWLMLISCLSGFATIVSFIASVFIGVIRNRRSNA
jgi:hypothetical protein